MLAFSTYLQAWTAQGNTVQTMDLSIMDKNIKIITINGVNCDIVYVKGSNTFKNTGLEFNQSFEIVKASIAVASSKGQTVMLSVKGNYKTIRYNDIIDIANDLGCHGIDLDYEPNVDMNNPVLFGTMIPIFKKAIYDKKGPAESCHLLSAAVLNLGAFPKNSSSSWYGFNILGLHQYGYMLDWINVMAYDVGPPSIYSPEDAFAAYRKIYNGKIFIGIELGKQGYGGYITNMSDITSAAMCIKKDNNGGIFVWAYRKDSTGSPNFSATMDKVLSVFN